ncbi:M10 family metallopeptidase C-terminal domain-containing protein [Rhizobium sp. ARZ01]|uniref:M10 family metallopeptidase n=1 Tax=Rhizobium sp. ARZ01 TaxID=2769313 RepID=UPI0017840DA3|nr:M10 family metallopeptidase [Rhizobium sp. ARZ01]MBD9371446.1 M10 family metallopeptidase C-terminal domain-containing protein [Rhizobium sp. ARZ01]
MATYTTNGLGVESYSSSDIGKAGWLGYGYKWGGPLGTGVTLTYSFPVTGSKFADNYSYEGELDGWGSLTSTEISYVRYALQAWAGAGDVKFKEVADNTKVVGELRFTQTDTMDDRSAAHAYYPWNHTSAGDVWFNTAHFNKKNGDLKKGSYDYLIILHEVGHALGLQHPFEIMRMPSSLDNFFNTVMSYTASPWSADQDNYASFYPTTPMYYDLLAIQTIYGKNLSVNNGNNTYTFKDGTKYWQAINDTGGVDTIAYSGIENSTINLNPGKFSSISERIHFSYGKSSRATVTIGPDVIIENAIGGNGNDTLIGNTVANVLNGGVGRDTMYGRKGGDTYYVNNSGDIVDESVSGSDGTDTVRSSISFSLASTKVVRGSVENLILLGSSALSGTGNGLNNTIVGNSGSNALTGNGGNDVLNGGGGRDTMRGGSGNDIYYVDNTGDVVDESLKGSNGTDTIRSSISFSLANTKIVKGSVEHLLLTGTANISGAGNSLHNTITGNSGTNLLTGNAGNDTLNGGLGRDTMRGGSGSDTYYVDNTGDIVDESQSGSNGTDTVRSSVSFSLAQSSTLKGSVENLALLGSAGLWGTGNSLNNAISGNSGNNSLSGGSGDDVLNGGSGNDILNGDRGRDTMRGGAGNDTYHVDNVGDVIDESLSGSNGTDTVQSSISFSLANTAVLKGAVENLLLLGSANLSGTGNSLNNTITGNAGHNRLSGGAGDDDISGGAGDDVLSGGHGRDTLTGGVGFDIFVFDTAPGGDNEDTITDFNTLEDRFHLDSLIFGLDQAGDKLTPDQFCLGVAAIDADDRIIYDLASGLLSYDKDGFGGQDGVVFARLTNQAGIDHDRFWIA